MRLHSVERAGRRHGRASSTRADHGKPDTVAAFQRHVLGLKGIRCRKLEAALLTPLTRKHGIERPLWPATWL
jgi:hypothetical protein